MQNQLRSEWEERGSFYFKELKLKDEVISQELDLGQLG